MQLGDRFEQNLYYIETIDTFHLLDANAKPTSNSLVATARLPDGHLIIEQFRGQPHIGVVRVLEKYQLRRQGWRDLRN